METRLARLIEKSSGLTRSFLSAPGRAPLLYTAADHVSPEKLAKTTSGSKSRLEQRWDVSLHCHKASNMMTHRQKRLESIPKHSFYKRLR